MFLNFWRFEPQIVLKLFLFSNIPKQWISCPKQQIGAKKCVCYCFIQRYAKNLRLSIQCPRNVSSLLITPLVPHDAANSNESLYKCASQSVYKNYSK